MTVTFDRPTTAPTRPAADIVPVPEPAAALVVGGAASVAAGTIHAAAIAAHSDHRQAVWAFVALSVAQLAWGAYAVARGRRRRPAAIGVLLGAAAIVGWVLAKTTGIPGIDGLDDAEPIRFADGLGAALAMAVLFGSADALLRRGRRPHGRRALAAGVLLAAAAVPGAAAAVDHPHDAGHTAADGTPLVPSAVPPRAFDPDLPIDLGGVPGVSPQQQARAENLLAITLLRLPQWKDADHAEANGFRSIGDGVTGTEHFVNPTFMADDTILDPDQPESLVFDVDLATGERTLSAAMYMMPPGSTLDDVPDIGGALTQWHIHNNLCFNEAGRVAGLTDGDGSCAAPLVKGPETPMIHVWIRRHPCGPFAALEGIGGGQVAEGEMPACDELHGG